MKTFQKMVARDAEIVQLREDLTATKENRDLYLRRAKWMEARLAEFVQLTREMSHERYNGGNSAREMVRWDTCLDRLEVFAESITNKTLQEPYDDFK